MWDKYFFHRILYYAHNRKPSVHVAYEKLNARLPESHVEEVLKQSDGTYSVPSATTACVAATLETRGHFANIRLLFISILKHSSQMHRQLRPRRDTSLANWHMGQTVRQKHFLDLQESAVDCNIDVRRRSTAARRNPYTCDFCII